jgi:hypothetical protein
MMTFDEKVRTFNVLYTLYRSPSNTSLFKGVPISMREKVLAYYKSMGWKVKLRYRGPRTHGTQSYCVLQDATTFAVYIRTW